MVFPVTESKNAERGASLVRKLWQAEMNLGWKVSKRLWDI